MLFIKLPKSRCEILRKRLSKMDLLISNVKPLRYDDYIAFPVKESIKDVEDPEIKSLELLDIDSYEAMDLTKGSFKDYLKRYLNEEELKHISNGYDIYGSIAVIDIDNSLKDKAKLIAKALMDFDKRIKTVLAKKSAVSGAYRTREFSYIYGRRSYIAEHKENGCIFRYDIRKVFFSNRLAFERKRVYSLVKDHERVYVMFSGVAPFSIEIAKHTNADKILSAELNPYGHRYAIINCRLNNISYIDLDSKIDNRSLEAALSSKERMILINANVSDLSNLEAIDSYFDRIVMPLPRSTLLFLNEAYKAARDNATVHLYAFSDINNPFESIKRRILEHAEANGYKIEFLFERVVRNYSPQELEVVIDYRIIKNKKLLQDVK
ncbi:MAG: tRNA (guanine(37)-N1)-methyltransferase [Candidatus Micrarchaeota archaeon]|nr:MAG: tRNA (guanine(37)-N1)-methyltransferase [Candidatus Micrarchaeota archaeon]